ncbi:hypothetical protein HDE_12492 [Halotydeus destructor]|nr:hypothetical protein HDE_12492 [Halotydeus destructor]
MASIELVDRSKRLQIDHFSIVEDFDEIKLLESDKFYATLYSSDTLFDEYQTSLDAYQAHPLSPSYLILPHTFAEDSSQRKAVVYTKTAHKKLSEINLKLMTLKDKIRLIDGILSCLSHVHDRLNRNYGSLNPKCVFWDIGSATVLLSVPELSLPMNNYEFNAPERLVHMLDDSIQLDQKLCDVWSFGVVSYYILTSGAVLATGGQLDETDYGLNDPDIANAEIWQMLNRYLTIFEEEQLGLTEIMKRRRLSILGRRVDQIFLSYCGISSDEKLDEIIRVVFKNMIRPDPSERLPVQKLRDYLSVLRETS